MSGKREAKPRQKKPKQQAKPAKPATQSRRYRGAVLPVATRNVGVAAIWDPANQMETKGGNRQRWVRMTKDNPLDDDFLSEIARQYVMELVNPFDGPLVGIPTTPVLNTRVDRLFTKGSSVTGTGGFGFVSFSPAAAATAPNFCCRSTTAAYAGTTISFVAAGTTDQSSTSSFANADLGAASTSVQARVVSAGLRCRCTSAVMNLGGRAVGLHQPAHGTLDGYGTNTALTYEDSASFQASESVGNDWFTLIYRPVDSTDFDFFISAIPQATSSYMGWFFEADDPGTPTRWEWQAFALIEYQGAQVQHKVPSLSDPVGADAAHSIIAAVPHLKKPHKEKSEHMSLAAVATANHYARHSTSHGGDRHHGSSSSSSSGGGFFDSLGKVFTSVLPALGGVAASIL